LDGPALHQRVWRTGRAPRAAVGSAHDAAVIPKRGQPTWGLGPFFHGGASRAERGGEMSTRAGVEVTRRGALTLAVAPTPPGEQATTAAPAESRVDCSKPPRRAPRQRGPPRLIDPGVDGY
jgi:hypothetical protein